MVMIISRRALARWATSKNSTTTCSHRWISSTTRVRATAAAVTSGHQDAHHHQHHYRFYYSAAAMAGLATAASTTVALMEEQAPIAQKVDADSRPTNVASNKNDHDATPASISVQATSVASIADDSKHIPVGKYDNHPPPRPDLPTIPLEEVADHCDEESMWFTFRGAVYDLTFFINGHPGGTTVRSNEKYYYQQRRRC